MMFAKVPAFKREDEKSFNYKDIEERLHDTLTVELHDLWIEYMATVRKKREEYDALRINKYYLGGYEEDYPSDIRVMNDMRSAYENTVRRHDKASEQMDEVEQRIATTIEQKSIDEDEQEYISKLKDEATKKDKDISKRLNKHLKEIQNILDNEYRDVKTELKQLHKVDRLNKSVHMYWGLKTERPSIRMTVLETETDKTLNELRKIAERK